MSTQNGQLPWRRSRRCGNGNCVEAAKGREAVYVRDSKDPAGPWLTFALSTWTAFVDAIKAGNYDPPAE
jgi:hypothetical protein